MAAPGSSYCIEGLQKEEINSRFDSIKETQQNTVDSIMTKKAPQK